METFNLTDLENRTQRLYQLAEQWIEEYVALLPEITREKLGTKRPKIVFSLKYTTTGGRCYGWRDTLIINQHIANDADIKDILGHELAHWLAWHLFQHKGHGDTWQMIMQWLKLTATRTHHLDELKALRRGDTYRCASCNYKWFRSKDITHGYHCRCGGKIVKDTPNANT